MGLTLVFWDPFLSFLSDDLIHTHDIGHTSVYGLEIALHSLQLLNRALLYMWYFNGIKQTNKHTHTHTHTRPFSARRSILSLGSWPTFWLIALPLLHRFQ